MDRQGLAGLLRLARERLAPAQVGLPPGPRRRVPGLRREEVAALAGISVDYLIRLEQARGPNPSAPVLEALAQALRLTGSQRQTMFELAGAQPAADGHVPMHVRRSVRQLLQRLAETPALVVSAKGDVLAWNNLAATLLGHFSTMRSEHRNLNLERFLGNGNRIARTVEECDHSKEQAVARLRRASARYPKDPDLCALVRRLRQASPQFERLWQKMPVETHASHPKTVDHPRLGLLTLDCETLLVPDVDQTVMVFSAEPGTPAHDQLALLRALDGAPDRERLLRAEVPAAEAGMGGTSAS